MRIHSRAWLAALVLAAPVQATENSAVLVPHLDSRGQQDYINFLAAAGHRAFVIAPGGTYAWSAEMPSEDLAVDTALEECDRHTDQQCVPYAVDDRKVFDAAAWPLTWGPYLTAQQAGEAAVGLRRGQRFPDLVFQTPTGQPSRLSTLRGKVVVLHFWGSWCGPCQREMPELQKLREMLKATDDVEFVLLPVREPLEIARQWAEEQNIRLPIAFGGDETVEEGVFQLADGGKLTDRDLAKAFPTTYILDKHGVVVFSRIGPVPRWLEFVSFLNDAAAKSGQ